MFDPHRSIRAGLETWKSHNHFCHIPRGLQYTQNIDAGDPHQRIRSVHMKVKLTRASGDGPSRKLANLLSDTRDTREQDTGKQMTGCRGAGVATKRGHGTWLCSMYPSGQRSGGLVEEHRSARNWGTLKAPEECTISRLFSRRW